jgi:putative MFS transporter
MTCGQQANADQGTGAASTSVDKAMIVARLERLPTTSFHLTARVVAGVATLFDAFDSLAIAYVLPVLAPLWKIAPQEIGMLIAIGSFGQLLGALFFGWLADRIGRMRALALSVAVFGLCSLGCAASWSYGSLFVFRFLQGIGLGGEVPVAGTYIGEMAKARGRGFFFLIYEGIFGVGLFLAAVAGVYLVPRWGWQSMFLVGALPALLAAVIQNLLPESARWLADRGRVEEADRIVSKIEALAMRGGKQLPAPEIPAGSADITKTGTWGELFSGVYLRRSLVVWVLWFCSYFVGYGSTTWMPSLYRTIFSVDLGTALTYGMITVACGTVGTLLVAFLVDRTGRRAWFTMAALGTSLPLLFLWLHGPDTATLLLICASISFFFNGSNSNMLYLYSAEIYPTRLRARGVSVGTAWLRLGSLAGPLAVGFIVSGGNVGAVFLMFGLVALVSTIVGGIFITETRRRVLEEVSP